MTDNSNSIIKSINTEHISNRILFIRNLLKGKQLEPIKGIGEKTIGRIDEIIKTGKLSEIKEHMRKFLGEEPGVDILYKKDVMINELRGEAEEIKAVQKVSIVFTDLDEKFKKIEFLID